MAVPRRVLPRLGGLTTPSSSTSISSAVTHPAARCTPLARSFISAAAQWKPKTPSLSDIEPNQAHVFDAKQADFRDNLAELNRQKKEKERQSASQAASAKSSSPSSSSSAPVSASHDPSPALGSLSTDPGESARQQDDGKRTKSGGRLSSLIYGTEEGREMDREIERSFSQILARGKYVHSITFHTVKPDKVDEYVELIGDWFPKVANSPENKVHLVGSWRTEVGDGDTFVHIWEYQRYSGYHASLHTIRQHPEYPAFDKKLKQLITSRSTSLMQEFRFWPTSPPRQLGGIFELRSYTLHPGNLLEWETHWQKGLAARREVMEGVGAWFVQVGALNEVHHLWQFADLEERRARREKSWGVSGWADTVHKTVPLIQTMKSRIMVPMPWSPIG